MQNSFRSADQTTQYETQLVSLGPTPPLEDTHPANLPYTSMFASPSSQKIQELCQNQNTNFTKRSIPEGYK